MFYVTKFTRGRWYWLCETGRSEDPLEWGFKEQAKAFDPVSAATLAQIHGASLEAV